MNIATKTQTNRATNYKEGFNCVNLFLQDRFSNTTFEIGLQVTEWGDKNKIEPSVIFTINNKFYRYTLADFIKLAT